MPASPNSPASSQAPTPLRPNYLALQDARKERCQATYDIMENSEELEMLNAAVLLWSRRAFAHARNMPEPCARQRSKATGAKLRSDDSQSRSDHPEGRD